MIEMKQWMTLINYRISEGNDYTWHCFGDNAYMLDSWDGDHSGYSTSIMFDTKTQVVYQVEVHDYKRQQAYRYTNPDYRAAHAAAEKSRESTRFDEYPTTELEVADDWLSKASAIAAYEDYDTGILVPLDFTDAELMPLFKAAHDADMSFNAYVCMALRDMITKLEKDGALVNGWDHESCNKDQA